MWTYIFRRLLYAIPILMGVLLLTFLIFFASTTTESLARQRLGKSPSPAQILEQMRLMKFAELSPEGLEKTQELEKIARGEIDATAKFRESLKISSEPLIEFLMTAMQRAAAEASAPKPTGSEEAPESTLAKARNELLASLDVADPLLLEVLQGKKPLTKAFAEAIKDSMAHLSEDENEVLVNALSGAISVRQAYIETLPLGEAEMQATLTLLAELRTRQGATADEDMVEDLFDSFVDIAKQRAAQQESAPSPTPATDAAPPKGPQDAREFHETISKLLLGTQLPGQPLLDRFKVQSPPLAKVLDAIYTAQVSGEPPTENITGKAFAELRDVSNADVRTILSTPDLLTVFVGEMSPAVAYSNMLKLRPSDTIKYGKLRLGFDYVVSSLTFDFGETNDKRVVMDVIGMGMGPSLKLMVPAFILSEFFGVFLALFAALYRNTRTDRLLILFSVLIMSVSPVAMIIFAQKFFAADWKYFPISGYAEGIPGYIYLFLPMFLYVFMNLGANVRFNRILMLDEINQDYVRTAKAKGVGQNVVLFKHVFRNALIPLITRWAVAIPMLYLGSLLLETFFAIPGLGGITVDAAVNRDINTIKALVFIGTIIYILSTLVSDVLYAVVDPRVKLK